MSSKQRWISHGFEITCGNAEVIRCEVIIDAHNREVIAWRTAADAHISSSDICDLMREAAAKHFGDRRADQQVELLCDYGSAYVTWDACAVACQLGFKLCFAPVSGPERKGISESFMRTLVLIPFRDAPPPSAETTHGLLSSWFENFSIDPSTP